MTEEQFTRFVDYVENRFQQSEAGFDAQFQQMDARMDRLESLVKAETQALGDSLRQEMRERFEIADDRFRALEKGQESLSGDVGEVRRGLNEVRGGVNEVRGGLNEVRGGLNEVRGGVNEVRGGLSEVRGGLSEVRGGLSEVRSRLEKVEVEVRENSARITDLKEDMQQRFRIVTERLSVLES